MIDFGNRNCLATWFLFYANTLYYTEFEWCFSYKEPDTIDTTLLQRWPTFSNLILFTCDHSYYSREIVPNTKLLRGIWRKNSRLNAQHQVAFLVTKLPTPVKSCRIHTAYLKWGIWTAQKIKKIKKNQSQLASVFCFLSSCHIVIYLWEAECSKYIRTQIRKMPADTKENYVRKINT